MVSSEDTSKVHEVDEYPICRLRSVDLVQVISLEIHWEDNQCFAKLQVVRNVVSVVPKPVVREYRNRM